MANALPPELIRGPFTLATAEAAGVTRKVLRGSRFRRLYRGVYVPNTLPDSPLVRARAALLAAPYDAWVTHTHLGGVRRARLAFAFARDRVDSPMETVLRLCLRFARLPEPAVNVVVGDPMDPVGRPDLPYLQYQVGVEYDGEYHFAGLKQRQHDNVRREAFENVGWRLVIVTKQDMLRPREVVWRVYRALRERGYHRSPPAFDDVWCRWFERVPFVAS